MVDEGSATGLSWLDATLARALESQRAHALLVQAAEGLGAFEFMLALAQGWLCEGSQPAPCQRCASCRMVAARQHPDLHLLVPEARRAEFGVLRQDGDGDDDEPASGKRKPSRQIRIGEVRQAIDWVAQSTSRGRAKVVLMHPAEAMNPQAANALLKTLEEPPRHARLLLGAADAEALLPTVRSRCQRLLLPPPTRAQALQWLHDQGLPQAEVLLAAASGRPLQARALARAGLTAEAWSALPQQVARGRVDGLAGWPVAQAIDALQKLCHDAMAVAVGAPARYFPAASVPRAASLPALTAWARRLADIARHDEHPWNEALLLEALAADARAALAAATPKPARRSFDTLAR